MKFKIEKCKNKDGISVKPLTKVNLNFKKLKQRFEVKVDTPIILIINKEGEIIIHNYGDLLFKELKNKDKIKVIADEIYKNG